MNDKMRSFKNIAQLVKDRRLAHPKKYSQAELSHALGYKNGQFISNVERGICAIPLKSLKSLMGVLEITENDLMDAMMKDYEDTINNYLVAAPPREVQNIAMM